MRTRLIYNKYLWYRLTPSRIAFLGMYLALLISLKYLFGFLPGIEMVTFLFIIAGMFIPLFDAIILVMSFNLLMIALYGWGTWQIMYWLIWPFDILITKLLTKFTRNRYIFSVWGFLCGFSLIFWYFISDYFFLGYSYAIANTITAIPINLIEGMFTTLIIIAASKKISEVFRINSYRLWNKKNGFTIKAIDEKNKKINITIIMLVNALLASGIVILFVYNQIFFDWQESLIGHYRAWKIT